MVSFSATALLRLLALASPANAAFWNLTSYYMMSATYTTLKATIDNTPVPHTLTRTLVTQLVDFTPAPTNPVIKSSTYSYDDVDILYATITYDAAIPTSLYFDSDEQYSSRSAADTATDGAVTNYMYTETYVAPADCTALSPTLTVGIRAYVDSQVTPYITPTALSTSTDYETYTYRRSTRTTVETSLTVWAWAPRSEFPPLATATDYFYTAYISACRMPTRASGYGYSLLDAADTATATATARDRTLTGTLAASATRDALVRYVEASNEVGGTRSFLFWRLCGDTQMAALQAAKAGGDVSQLCYEMQPWTLAVCVVFPLLFVCGFGESFFWFNRAMRGEKALRLGTVCWMVMCFWVVLFTRISPAQSEKVVKEQAIERWTRLALKDRLRLWLQYGLWCSNVLT